MPDEMTPERTLIVLNQCNTDGRIKVDREELKEAVKMASIAIKRYMPIKPRLNSIVFKGQQRTVGYFCPNCGSPACVGDFYCDTCGQALDWSKHE